MWATKVSILISPVLWCNHHISGVNTDGFYLRICQQRDVIIEQSAVDRKAPRARITGARFIEYKCYQIDTKKVMLNQFTFYATTTCVQFDKLTWTKHLIRFTRLKRIRVSYTIILCVRSVRMILRFYLTVGIAANRKRLF